MLASRIGLRCSTLSLLLQSARSMATVAVAQYTATQEKGRNVGLIAQAAHRGVKCGAQMLFLPECCGFMGRNANETLQAAEELRGDLSLDPSHASWISDVLKTGELAPSRGDSISLIPSLQAIARETGLWISAGGVHTKATNNKVHNTHLILDGDGNIRAHYHKIHLFDVSIPGQVDLQESRTTEPGQDVVVCECPVGKLGVTICYDLRFPELYQRLVHEGNAEILLVPSAFTVPTGRAHWHTLLRARAIENQCFVIAAAQSGMHNEKRESYGHALIVDPWGTVLADAMYTQGDDLEVLVADLDLSLVQSTRERMPVQQHRLAADYS